MKETIAPVKVRRMILLDTDCIVTQADCLQEAKKRFERCSDDLDSVLSKYMGKKPRDPTINEVRKRSIG